MEWLFEILKSVSADVFQAIKKLLDDEDER